MNKDKPVKKIRKEKKEKENQKGKTSFSHASVGKKYLFPPQTHFPSSFPEVGSTNNAHGFYPSVSNSSWYFHYND